MADVETGQIIRFMHGKGLINFALSPNGQSLAVMGNARLKSASQLVVNVYLVTVPRQKDSKLSWTVRPSGTDTTATDVDGNEIVPVCQDLCEESGFNMSWSPNGKHLAVATHGELANEDVYLVDVATRTVRNLTEKLEAPPSIKSFRTRLYAADTRPTRKIYSDRCPPLWTRDSQGLFCMGQGDIWLIPTQGTGGPRNLTKDNPRQFDHLLHANSDFQPLFSKDGKSIFALTRTPKTYRYGFCRVDIETGKVQMLREEEQTCGDLRYEGHCGEDVATQAGQVAYALEGPTRPPEIWLSDTSFESPRQVTKINPAWDAATARSVRLLRWKTTQGKEAEGLLLLPPQARATNKVPMVARVYGGAPGIGRFSGLFPRRSWSGIHLTRLCLIATGYSDGNWKSIRRDRRVHDARARWRPGDGAD